MDVYSDRTLKMITDVIVSSAQPQKIILFGSRARGTENAESDYDLLVVKDHLENERVLTRIINRDLFSNNISVPVDVIAVDSDRLQQNCSQLGMIYRKALNEGKILYG